MPKRNEVEEILSRLMPVPLSEAGEEAIRETIDQLAHEGGLEDRKPAKRSLPWWLGAAAALGLSLLVFFRGADDGVGGRQDLNPPDSQPSVVPLAQTDWVESIESEGWHEDETGAAHQAVRVKLVARQEVMDAETGIRMTVSEPREELLLVPVVAF